MERKPPMCEPSNQRGRKGTAGTGREGPGDTQTLEILRKAENKRQLLLGKRTRRNEECVEMRNHDRSRTIHIRGKQTVERISQKENQQQQPPSPMPGGQR